MFWERVKISFQFYALESGLESKEGMQWMLYVLKLVHRESNSDRQA